MTESVARVKILAQIEGLEGFDKLKGAFKGLQTAIGPADSELEKARKSIIEFGKAGKASEQVIQGQISALKALQGQAAIGGAVYRQLAKDVKALGNAYQEAATGAKKLTDATLSTQFVGAKAATFDPQIAALRRGLNELSVYEKAYTSKLTEIQRRQQPFNAAVGRQGVIAAFEAYAQGPLGPGSSGSKTVAPKLPELPDTTAALNQRLSELSDRLRNVTRGGQAYADTVREINAVQKQLNETVRSPQAQAAYERLLQSRQANAGSGFRAFSGRAERVNESINYNRQLFLAGQRASNSPMGPDAPSELWRNIAGIGNQSAANQLQLMKRSFNEVASSIREATLKSDGSVNSLQRQRASWQALQNAVGANTKEFKLAARELAVLDKQLERTQPGGLRGKIGYIGQGIGAAASAGIFGGPEGALGGIGGGAIGALLGGPAGFAAGSFIGSSVGAYAGMGRQALGGFSTYAADISKLEIALKGVTKTQDEYQRALAASASVTRDFNVPQLEATRGMTQLSAAVIGAGGKVADAEVVFRNVTAAIKASGGSAEDVQGALTALGQIFSKGKVSAEELQGQLGERLPGAVTMFAKATGRTLPQLQKDLEQGVVGLADLMKFVTSDQGLGQFEQRAKAVADSSADAGARLTATWNDTKRAIGEALLPLGSQIQDSLAGALRDATPALVGFAKGLSAAIKILVDNGPLIAGVLKTLLGFGAVVGVAAGVVQLAGAFTAATAAIASMGGAMSVASLAARTLGVSIAAIPGIGWIAAGVTALGLLSAELYNNNNAFRTWVNNVASIISSDFKAAWDNAALIVKTSTEAIQSYWDQLVKIASKIGSAIASAFAEPFGVIASVADTVFGGVYRQIVQLINSIPEPIRKRLYDNAVGTGASIVSMGNPFIGYGASVGIRALTGGAPTPGAGATGMYGRYDSTGGQAGQSQTSSALTEWEKLQAKIDSDKKKAAEKAKSDAERFAAEQQRLNESVAKAEIELARTVFNNQMELIRKRYDYEQERIQMQRDVWAGTFEGVRSESARAANEFLNRLEQARQRVRSATLGVVTAQQNAAFSAQMEAVTGQGLTSSASGGAGVSGFTAEQLRAASKEASRFTGIANMCSESVKAFYKSLGVSLPGVTAWADTVRNAGTVMRDWSQLKSGDIVATGRPGDTPHVGVYTGGNNVFHQSRSRGLVAGNFPDLDYFKSGGYFVRPAAGVAQRPAGVAAQARRNVAAGGRAGSASAEVGQANAMLGLEANQAKFLLQNEGVRYVQQRTQGLRDEAKALENSNELLLKRMKLEQQGLRPEVVDAQMKIAEIEQQRADKIAQINQNIAQNQYDAEAVGAFRLEIEETNAAYDRQIAAVNTLAQAQTASGVALNAFIGQQKQALAEMANLENFTISMAQTIESSLSGAISSAVTNLVTGAQSIKQTLADMFRSIGEAFIKMAADIIAKQLVIVALNSIAKVFGGASGMGSPAGSGGGISNLNFAGIAQYGGVGFANGGVMTTRGPLPLKRYAAGGVANSPQMAVFGERGPEAYVPLPDGRSIPVKMKQRNDALNRYRPIGATGTMAPGSEAAAAGGAAGGAAGPIDVRYSVERINNVEYVTAEQFQQGLRQAAAQGAQRGEQRAIRSLQQSTAVRSRVGMR